MFVQVDSAIMSASFFLTHFFYEPGMDKRQDFCPGEERR